MRSVSYVQRVALEFGGSLFPHAICLGDVDNDTVSACALRETRSGSAALLGVGRGQGSGEADRGVGVRVRVAPAPCGWRGGLGRTCG